MRADQVDGNVLAGVMSELLSADVTMLLVTCATCGSEGLLAECVVERDDHASIVRCRGCTHTLFTLLRAKGGATRLRIGAIAQLSSAVDPL